MNYYAYSPATDTTEIATVYRGAYWERTTTEIEFPWLKPAVERVTLVARLRLLILRILASPAATHLRASADSAYWVGVLCFGLLAGLGLAYMTRGQVLMFDGYHDVPVPR